LARTLRQIVDVVGLNTSVVVRYNNKAFMLDVCTRLGIENTTEVFALLDKYYKLSQGDFDQKLAELLTSEQIKEFVKLRDIQTHKNDFPEIKQYIKPLTDRIRPGIKGVE